MPHPPPPIKAMPSLRDQLATLPPAGTRSGDAALDAARAARRAMIEGVAALNAASKER